MALTPTTVLAPILTILSLYAAQKSYIAITNLQQYEEKSEKAAKYSETAAHELYKTRMTQASGAATVLFSFASSITLFFRPNVSSILPLVNVAVITAAYTHVTNFWKLKAQVPFVTGFNEGIRKSNDLRQVLVVLGGFWAVSGALGLLY